MGYEYKPDSMQFDLRGFAARNATTNHIDAFPVSGWQLAWYIMITVVGVPGNFLVGCVILSSDRRVKFAPFNLFLLSLASSDLLLSLFAVPGYLLSTSYVVPSSSEQGTLLCKTVSGYLVQFWLTCVSLYTLTAMSLQRQQAICYPLTSRISDPRKTLKIILFVWIFALIVQIPTPVGIEYSTKPLIGNFCSYKWSYGVEQKIVYIIVILCQYIAPLLLMVYSLTRTMTTLRQLHRSDSFSHSGLFSSNNDHSQWISRRRRTMLTLVLVVIAFFFCVTPNEIMYFMAQFRDFHLLKWNSTANQIGVMLFITNSCINPFLYAFSSKEFRCHACRSLRKLKAGLWWPFSSCSSRRRWRYSNTDDSAGLLRTV